VAFSFLSLGGYSLRSTVLVPLILASAPPRFKSYCRPKLLGTLNISFRARQNSSPHHWLQVQFPGHLSRRVSSRASGLKFRQVSCNREDDFWWDIQPLPVPLIATYTLTLCMTAKSCSTLRAIFQATRHFASYPSRTIFSPRSWYDSLLYKRFGQRISARHLTS
jgi:hypothetical protein